MMEPVYAHQGGWDEILWLLVLVGLALYGLRRAERRARRRAEAEEAGNGAGMSDRDVD